MNDDLPNLPEHVRKSLDILDQWTSAATNEWIRLHEEMRSHGISIDRTLQISGVAQIQTYDDSGRGAFFYVLGIERTLHSLRTALQSGVLDISYLPELRRLTLKTFEDCRKQISDAKEKADKARSARIAKLSEVLPQCIDEFGADVMQFGPGQKGKTDAAVSYLGSNVGFYGTVGGGGIGPGDPGGLDEIERRLSAIEHREAAEKARARLSEIQHRMTLDHGSPNPGGSPE